MPIPPRPIPTQPAYARRAPRPGVSIKRKGAYSPHSLVADSLAEIPLLPSMGTSAPSATTSLHGVRFVSRNASRPTTPPASTSLAREVPLASLMDGRGRAKRVGTAATLGFDFVPNPTVVAMHDTEDTSPTPSTQPTPAKPVPSLWSWGRKDASGATPEPPVPAQEEEGAAARALASSPAHSPGPGTPVLDPSWDDEWEHVDHEKDDEASIVGELELEIGQFEDLEPPLDASVCSLKRPTVSYAKAVQGEV